MGKVLRIGLTGNIGTGKSTVRKIIEELKEEKIKVLDADKIVHKLLEDSEIKKKLIEKLGEDILSPEGNISRKKIAEKVFNDRELLKWLENLLHPKVYEEYERVCKKLKEKHGGGLCILEASLIFEKGNEKKFDYIITVYAPYSIALKRSLKSKKISEEDFLKRWRLQLPIEEKVRKAHFVIDNSKDLKHTLEQTLEIIRKLMKEVKS
jgi:dephospho-CoA kinase